MPGVVLFRMVFRLWVTLQLHLAGKTALGVGALLAILP